MQINLDEVISFFQKTASAIFNFYRSVSVVLGAAKVSVFDVFLFLMVVYLLLTFLTGYGGDDD